VVYNTPYLRREQEHQRIKNPYNTTYRDRNIILYQILILLKKSREGGEDNKNKRIGSTRLMYTVRFNSDQFKRYMGILIETNLVEKKEDNPAADISISGSLTRGRGTKRKKLIRKPRSTRSLAYYTITQKGLRYIELVQAMRSLISIDEKGFIFPQDLDNTKY
jgi:predicted transcriptional regulator